MSNYGSVTQPPTDSPITDQRQLNNFKVYNPISGTSLLPGKSWFYLPLSDEFFTPTAADLRAAQATLSARSQALNNAPLQLRATREADAKFKLDRWPETNIRIKFIDGTQLEKAFLSSSKIRSIYAFVRGCLREDVQPVKFVLYQPPKRDLKVSDANVRDLTLAQLHLAPSSILLLRFEDDKLNHTDVRAPLDANIIAQAVDFPSPTTNESEDHTAETRSPAKAGNAKVPKWLKLGKK